MPFKESTANVGWIKRSVSTKVSNVEFLSVKSGGYALLNPPYLNLMAVGTGVRTKSL